MCARRSPFSSLPGRPARESLLDIFAAGIETASTEAAALQLFPQLSALAQQCFVVASAPENELTLEPAANCCLSSA